MSNIRICNCVGEIPQFPGFKEDNPDKSLSCEGIQNCSQIYSEIFSIYSEYYINYSSNNVLLPPGINLLKKIPITKSNKIKIIDLSNILLCKYSRNVKHSLKNLLKIINHYISIYNDYYLIFVTKHYDVTNHLINDLKKIMIDLPFDILVTKEMNYLLSYINMYYPHIGKRNKYLHALLSTDDILIHLLYNYYNKLGKDVEIVSNDKFKDKNLLNLIPIILPKDFNLFNYDINHLL